MMKPNHILYATQTLNDLRDNRLAIEKTLHDGGFDVCSLDNLILELQTVLEGFGNENHDG